MNFVQPSKEKHANIVVREFNHNTMNNRKRQLTLMRFEEENIYGN